MVTWLAACVGTSSTGIEPLDSGGLGTFPSFGPDLVFVDADVGTYAGEWVFPSIQVAPQYELFIGWDAVTADGWGLERDADSYSAALLLRGSGSTLDFERALASGTVGPVLADSWSAVLDPGQTDIALSDLGIDPADLVEDPETTWLFTLADKDGDRWDVRTGLVLVPTAASPGFFVDVPNGAAEYTFSTTFAQGVVTEAGYDAYTVDFGAVTADAYGRPLDPVAADELFVGRFEGVTEGDDLAGAVHELATTATGWWTMPTGGDTSLDLSGADGQDGPFPGFDADAAWLVGVRCTTCFEPAPVFAVPVTVR